jgi:hypothetical protein
MLGQFKSASMGAAGAVYGACFGVPIRMTKYIFSESHRMNQTLHDDFTDEPDIQATILARSMGIPYGIASGTILGIIHGVGDGVSKGYKKPFSKDSIGLGNQDPAAALSTKSPATSQLPNRSTLGTRP